MNLFGLLKLTITLIIITTIQEVGAQIIPDKTLGKESSTLNQTLIEGGAKRGGNLFHSFQEFNVQALESIYFANPQGVENILTRVTGNNISEIFGTLGVNGPANLFLINPNGINFGPKARLDIRGSFTATTADEILLGEKGKFSANQILTGQQLWRDPEWIPLYPETSVDTKTPIIPAQYWYQNINGTIVLTAHPSCS